MAVEPRHLLHSLTRSARPKPADDTPTVDLVARFPADDDPTEDVFAGEGPPVQPADPAVEAADSFAPGRTLGGRYRLEAVVGHGGFCTVLCATDLQREREGDPLPQVAIKVLQPPLRRSAGAKARLENEFRVLCRLAHPGIVRVAGLTREGDDPFLVMELLEGSTLATLMKHCEGRLPRARAAGILRACAEALDWAHRQQCAHGDVKPGNIFVTRAGEVRLLDFGGSPTPTSDLDPDTGRGGRFATPAYASPEVLAGAPPGPPDDLYSFACVAFEVLTGSHPYGRESALDARRRGLRPNGAGTLGHRSVRMLESGLALLPGERPVSAVAWLEALLDSTRAEAELPVAPQQPPSLARVGPRPGAIWKIPAFAAMAILALALALVAIRGGSVRTLDPMPGPAAGAVAVTPPPPVVTEAATGSLTAPDGDEAPAGAKAIDAAVPDGGVQPAMPAGGSMSFAVGELLVSRSAPAAAIPLRRLGTPQGAVQATWRIEEGTALAGRDFGGPLTGVVRLADGQQASTLFIALPAGSGSTEDARFRVALDAPAGEFLAGAASRVEVILRRFGADRPAG